MKKKIRIHYVTRAFQWKYAILTLILALIVAFMVGYTYKKKGMDYLVQKISNVYPAEQTYSIVANVNKKLAIYLGLISPLIIIFSLLLSHRVAGPITRIVHGLHQISEGDFSVRIKLRKGDELLDMAEGINEIAVKFGEVINQRRTGTEEIKREINALRSKLTELSIQNEDVSKYLNSIEEITANLEKSLAPQKV